MHVYNILKYGLFFIVRKIIYILTLLITIFIKRDPNLLVFGAWFGQKYSDNSKYLFEYLVGNHKEYKIVWVTKSDEVIKLITDKQSDRIKVCKSKSLLALYYQFRAKFFFTTTGRSDVDFFFLGGAIHIELWHGIPLKYICYDTIDSKAKLFLTRLSDYLHKLNYYVVCSSSNYKKIYSKAFDVNEKKVICLGQSRNDIFKLINRDIENKPYLLYMPTHRMTGNNSLNLDLNLDLDFIENLCELNGFRFLIKKHFYHSHEHLELFKYKNIEDVTNSNIDVQNLLLNSSCLITDYSSCFIDYMLMSNNIIFYCYDLDDYISNERQMYFSIKDIAKENIVKNVQEFNIELERFFNPKHEKKVLSSEVFYDNKMLESEYSASKEIVNFLKVFKKGAL